MCVWGGYFYKVTRGSFPYKVAVEQRLERSTFEELENRNCIWSALQDACCGKIQALLYCTLI